MTDQDDGKAGGDEFEAEGADFGGYFGLDDGGDRDAVEEAGCGGCRIHAAFMVLRS